MDASSTTRDGGSPDTAERAGCGPHGRGPARRRVRWVESRPWAVAAAVAAGALSMTAASAIITLLDKLSLRVDSAHRDAAERDLCQRAPGLRADELIRLLAHAEAELDRIWPLRKEETDG